VGRQPSCLCKQRNVILDVVINIFGLIFLFFQICSCAMMSERKTCEGCLSFTAVVFE
jgi:hypothetical protein